MTEQPGPEPVGSVGEEAAKLFGAISDWAREQQPAGPTSDGATSDGASTGQVAAEALRGIDQHLARGEDCRYCPVCQVIHAVRDTSPEVREHLMTAAGSLLHAVAGLLATQVPAPKDDAHGGRGGRERRSGPVERIDLDGDEPDDPEIDEESPA